MVKANYEYSQNLLGTIVSLTIYEANETAVKAVFATLKILEDKLTVNRPLSEVMSINMAAGKHAVEVSRPVFDLIAQALQISLQPNCYFNCAIGALVKLWQIGFKGQQVPTDEQIKQHLLLTNPRDIELNTDNHSIFLKRKGMQIDLGAIAKGYIADVIKEVLVKHNIHQAMINLGGNVLTIGDSPLSDDKNWHVGLKKPFSRNQELVGIINVNNRSVVTSGIYERFFYQHNHLYHHILNPFTGYPLDNELESVTIISKSSLEGDIYSTILYGLGVSKGCEFLQRHSNLAAIFLLKNKTIVLANTDNFYFQLLDKQYQVKQY
ncbi:thiamine biosynthesis protein ApbE [Gilliamella sp. wkB178]|uniref:FAD:protein FMN transferase n=1 Tax=Gilliamella sp. wkB178 TaxID=3120259 RepID=UPI00080DC2F3|nr:FAD:protein FMN transferase [Gilliamella apicola]OCG08085.1 thiamine biosynthesis protein ApbE [Gilliamella apicola]